MKKQFFAKFFIIVLLCSLTSCASLKTIDSNEVNTAINLANKQIELNQYEEALNTYNSALKDGYDYKLLYNKALILAELNYYNEAIKTLELGLKKYPSHTEFLVSKAKIFYLNNQVDDFISTYEKYLELANNKEEDLVEYMNLLLNLSLNEKAYEIAEELWQQGYDKKEVLNTLYSVNPDKWAIVKEALYKD